MGRVCILTVIGIEGVGMKIMERIKTVQINLLIDGKLCTHDIKKIIHGYNAEEELDIFQLKLNLNNKEYLNNRVFYIMELAIIDLHEQFPNNVKIACCQTCQYGNFCPYGDCENEIFCLLNHLVKDRGDVVDLFGHSRVSQ